MVDLFKLCLSGMLGFQGLNMIFNWNRPFPMWAAGLMMLLFAGILLLEKR